MKLTTAVRLISRLGGGEFEIYPLASEAASRSILLTEELETA